MAISADDLVTLEVARTFLGSPLSDDEKVQRIITASSQAINKHCGRLLKARDLIEIYDGDDTVELFVDEYPINSIASIHQDSTRAFAAGSLVTATDYLIDKSLRIIFGIKVYWVTGLQTIQVTYNAGYATVPNDLEMVTLILSDVWYKGFADHRFGVSGTSVGDKSITYETDIPKQVKNRLSSYVNRLIG